ncbi:hypothetical protein [Winogradskyella marincola]|uniref:Uncharacterized protein n=1 Tax=Winogradskyella marincola TaxID=3037795 RepID=A0ABT6FWZ9_9FLAO|nr:hypothetical protein [Winogradskyella sp. YYF002]MDG4714323.1 hypothetical protein [Winogradskyella sp. YYF002]
MSNGLKIDIPISNSLQVKDNLRLLKKILSGDFDQLSVINGIDIFKTNRSVESLSKNFKSVVCTTYFSSKKDPQRKLKIDSDDISYIAPWYNSMVKLKLEGIVFYDHLSNDFIQKYKTDHISFVKCQLGNYSLNDERFIIYYMFFLKHKADQILLTDGNDVVINKSPFECIDNKKKSTIFVGRGSENKLIHSNWNLDSINRLKEGLNEELPNNFYDTAIYNAGIIGGHYTTLLYFLRQMCFVFFRVNNDENNNMAAMHYVLYYYFYPNSRRLPWCLIYKILNKNLKIKFQRKLKFWNLEFLLNHQIDYKNDTTAVSKYIFSGYPLNSRFKQFETNSNAFITHK